MAELSLIKGQVEQLQISERYDSGGAMKEAKGLGFLRIVAEMGDAVTRHSFAKQVDSVISEKIVQNIFLIHAGAHVQDVLDLAREQALRETPDRDAMLRRMQSAQAFSSVMLDESGKLRPNAQVLTEKWAKMASQSTEAQEFGKFNAAKDARLALVVAVLELAMLGKAGYDAKIKADDKSKVVLASAVMSLGAAAVDVYANVVKGALEESSHTFQRFKLMGGVLGGVASILSVAAIYLEAEGYEKEGKVRLYRLATANLWVSGFAGFFNLATSLSYCGLWLTSVAERQASQRAGLVLLTRFGASAARQLAMYRLLLMGFGLGLNIAALGIQCLIWYFSDAELETWCGKCAFGKKRETGWTLKRQSEEFASAIYLTGNLS